MAAEQGDHIVLPEAKCRKCQHVGLELTGVSRAYATKMQSTGMVLWSVRQEEKCPECGAEHWSVRGATPEEIALQVHDPRDKWGNPVDMS